MNGISADSSNPKQIVPVSAFILFIGGFEGGIRCNPADDDPAGDKE